jgi:predicted Fe-Mo cluster-binding NifX family protein
MVIKILKIAAVTDDEFTISQHFDRAANYWVVTIENGVIVSEEKRHELVALTTGKRSSLWNPQQISGLGFPAVN